MVLGARIVWLLWPALLCIASVLAYAFHSYLFEHYLPRSNPEAIARFSTIIAFYSFAWLLARIAALALAPKNKQKRRTPKLLREMISATLFTIATVATIGLFLGQSAGGVLASSGLIIAILGFAIRNVLADVLSGIAIGVEAPFRIGDWVEFDSTTQGRVTEIGWRTTRILTPNDTYMILPNSQISRQMLTNYSAPRKHFQADLEIILGHDISIAEGKQLLFDAAMSTTPKDELGSWQKPLVRATAYAVEGVTYTIKYWVPRFSDSINCKDAMLVAIDNAIREKGLTPPVSRAKLMINKALKGSDEQNT
ncbi:mechanosensitive ion channel family protein [Pusillimonas sp. ANT_WB101]|uniref:mechanosensitive ion channel family protein n=1 Tax=Pusillimonas sp. ANT_WB101 TaxID=2597356 RepID=UPI0021028585|nr:mechanosensitive ion channel domain-containing protein [Pusillimonas sp. ANT_WB101]